MIALRSVAGEAACRIADAVATRAGELGRSVLMPPSDTGVGRTAVLADPAGAVFSVSEVV